MDHKTREKRFNLFMITLIVLVLIYGLSCNNTQISDNSDLKTYPKGNPIDTVLVSQPDTFYRAESDTGIIYWDWKYLVIHCTATPKSTTWKSIQNYWENNLGWKEPGYHFLIMPNGDIHVYKPYDFDGRITPDDIVNSVKGMNRYSVAISYVGGVDANGNPKDTRTEKQKESMDMLVAIARRTNPDVYIVGHRDIQIYTHKACPSFNVKEEYGLPSQYADISTDSLHIKIMNRVKQIYTAEKVKL